MGSPTHQTWSEMMKTKSMDKTIKMNSEPRSNQGTTRYLHNSPHTTHLYALGNTFANPSYYDDDLLSSPSAISYSLAS
jgi:hypothetical protein